MDLIRILVLCVMIAILVSLGNALFHLSKGDSERKMARALTVRIGLSLALFILLMLAWWFGLVSPNDYSRSAVESPSGTAHGTLARPPR